MTLPLYSSQIVADDIWGEFTPVSATAVGSSITGSSPNWHLTGGLGTGGVDSSHIGYRIRAPWNDERVGTITSYTYSPGYYGIGSWDIGFTMAGSAPPVPAAWALQPGSTYTVFPPRNGASIGLNSYHAGGGLVPSGTYGFPHGTRTFIPSSGTISYDNFHGAFNIVSYSVSTSGSAGTPSITVAPGTWAVMVRLQGAGGGGGGPDGGQQGAGGGDGLGMVARFVVTVTETTIFTIFGAGGGGRGDHINAGSWQHNGGLSAASGYFGTAYDAIVKGGDGGAPGAGGGGSGNGGGGGGAAVCGMQNNATSAWTMLALAGGGGGGAGAGQYGIISPGTIAFPNYRNRYLTYSPTTLTTLDQEYDLFSPFPPGGSAYRLAGSNSNGQGGLNLSSFYPPGSAACVNYDGGSGGGGGGGNGYGGGLCASSGHARAWSYVPSGVDKNNNATGDYWVPPSEFNGEGGGQGFCYANGDYVYSVNYSTIASTYGGGYGLAAAQSYSPTYPGGDGAAWLKVTNDLYDYTGP